MVVQGAVHWPVWVYCTQHLSHLLTVINSSVNFYIYCYKHHCHCAASHRPSLTLTTQVSRSSGGYRLLLFKFRQPCWPWRMRKKTQTNQVQDMNFLGCRILNCTVMNDYTDCDT